LVGWLVGWLFSCLALRDRKHHCLRRTPRVLRRLETQSMARRERDDLIGWWVR
jgi:hypothetical protein